MTIKHLFPDAWPTLNLDFANELALDPRITFSRSNIGKYTDKNGIIQTAAEDEPRFDYDPETGESLGLLIEEFRTNELENSDLDGLTEYGCETENSTEINPEGVASCRRIILDAGFTSGRAGHRITQRYADFFDETACSVFVKMDTHPYVLIGAGGQNRGYTAAFNIDPAFTGDRLLGQGGLSTHTNLDAGYESYPNGWFRIWATGTTSGEDGWSLNLSPDENTFTVTDWDAAGTEAIFAYGGQYEYAGFVTSYIPTNGAAVDRDADIATVDTTGLYGDEFTIVTEPFGVASGGNPLSLYGVHNKRTSVYPRYLPQEQINTVAKVGDFWMWRVLGSSWELIPRMDGYVTVDWGDGTTESLSDNVTVNHTFTNGSGYHEVGFRLDSGSHFSVTMPNEYAPEREKVVAVGPMPANMVTRGYYTYNYLNNVTAWDANIVHGDGSNLGRTYAGLTSLKSFPFTVLDPLITSISQAWLGCNNLNSFPLIDTSSIDNFGYSWEDCSSLPSFPHIDTSSGISFQRAWYKCSSLASFPSLDTSSGTDFANTWRNCFSLTSFPLIDTSSGKKFNQAWCRCESLTSFPLLDTSSGTDFESAWKGCNLLTSFPLIDTSSSTNFQSTWTNCNSLLSFPLLDTSSGINFKEAWQKCSSLTSFPLINTSSGNDFSFAWETDSMLTSFPLIDTSSSTTFQSAWKFCSNLLSFPLLDTSSGINFKEAWRACSSLTSFPSINTSLGTDFERTWQGCANLTSFPLLDTSSGTTFRSCWLGCLSLTDFPANFFDTTGTITVADAFEKTFQECALTAQSIENILVSLDTNGLSGTFTLDVDLATNAAQSSWSTAANTALANLQAKGWTVNYNP